MGLKLYLGCGPSPVHPQHLSVLGNPNDWTFVDYFVDAPHIKQWDATELFEVEEKSVDHIYASHLLEHISHVDVPRVLRMWRSKLVEGGMLTINVPDLDWACQQLRRLEAGIPLDGYYNQLQGEHGLLSIFYGSQSHEGEYHKSGYTQSSLRELLTTAGYSDVKVSDMWDAHEMNVLLATCRK